MITNEHFHSFNCTLTFCVSRKITFNYIDRALWNGRQQSLPCKCCNPLYGVQCCCYYDEFIINNLIILPQMLDQAITRIT